MRNHLDARRLLSGGVLVAAGNAGVVLLATRWLSPADRGVMVVAATIPAMVSLLASLGIGNAIKARRPKTPADQVHRLNQAFAALLVLTTVLGVVVSVLAAAATAPWVSESLTSPEMLVAVALGGGSLTLSTQLADGWFSGGRFAAGARWAAATALAGLLIVVVLRPATGAGVLLAQFGAAIVVQGVQLVFLARAGLVGAPRAHRAVVRELVGQGVPSLGQTMGSTVVLRADRLLLAFVVAPQVLAAYALASTISEASRLIPTSLGQVALRQASQHDASADVEPQVRLSRRVVLAVGIVATAASLLLVTRVFGPDYGSTPVLVAVMLVGEVFFSSYVIRSMALIGHGAARVAGRIGLVAALASVAAYLGGGMLWGALGCALAGVALYAGMGRAAHTALDSMKVPR